MLFLPVQCHHYENNLVMKGFGEKITTYHSHGDVVEEGRGPRTKERKTVV